MSGDTAERRRRAGSRTSQGLGIGARVELREEVTGVVCLRLGRFVSSMPQCLESALRRCELRHSVTLKAELRRSIEVVLAGNHFVAELSTGFEKSLIYLLLPFAFDNQSGGILVLALLRQDPPPPHLEAILVIFGRRALFFFCWKALEKNEK